MLFNKRCCGMQNQDMMFNQNMMGGCGQPNPCEREIVEPVINKCVEREFYHEVPQM